MSAKTLVTVSSRVVPAGREVRSPADLDPEGQDVRPALRRLPRSGWAILWVLRLTGQAGGSGCISWIYPTVLYVVLSVSALFMAFISGTIGARQVRRSGAFFTVAIQTSLFGATQVLTWLNMTCTFLVGRRRYQKLLSGLQRSMRGCKCFATFAESHGILSRRFRNILIAIAASIIVVMFNNYIKTDNYKKCKSSLCQYWTIRVFILATIEMIMFLVPLKLKFAGGVALCGIETVRTEIEAMAKQNFIDPAELRRLKQCQASICASFTQMTDGMTPELIACMFYGLIAQVSSFLLIVGIVQEGGGWEQTPMILLRLWGAVVTVVVPCEVGQKMLNQVSAIRDWLLELPPADLATNQEVLLHLEATRRDLDRLGDLSLYRLRRSTVLATTSTVITYIIVFLQFQVSEDTDPRG